MKTTTLITPEAVRGAVRETYGKIALNEIPGCRSPVSSCRDSNRLAATSADKLGYSADEVASAPEGADLGLGCGNPQAIASLKPGEAVLDLGSGAGFDCFLAARSVGSSGRVVGADMTPEMIEKARANAAKVAAINVEFRFGEIEALPVADNSMDVIISNCVINHPGGRNRRRPAGGVREPRRTATSLPGEDFRDDRQPARRWPEANMAVRLPISNGIVPGQSSENK